MFCRCRSFSSPFCDKIAPFFLPRCQWMTLMKDFLIASILSADFARLGEDVAKVLAAGLTWSISM